MKISLSIDFKRTLDGALLPIALVVDAGRERHFGLLGDVWPPKRAASARTRIDGEEARLHTGHHDVKRRLVVPAILADEP